MTREDAESFMNQLSTLIDVKIRENERYQRSKAAGDEYYGYCRLTKTINSMVELLTNDKN